MEKSTERLLGIAVVGCIAIGAVAYFTQPEFFSSFPAGQQENPAGIVAPPAAVPAPKSASSASPVMPAGAGTPGQTMRDLFAPPAGYAALLAMPQKGDATERNGSRNFSQGPLPALTGVIQGNGSRVAILRQGTISRSYRVGQAAGDYTVASIGPNSVTLTGPAGTKVLTIGQ